MRVKLPFAHTQRENLSHIVLLKCSLYTQYQSHLILPVANNSNCYRVQEAATLLLGYHSLETSKTVAKFLSIGCSCLETIWVLLSGILLITKCFRIFFFAIYKIFSYRYFTVCWFIVLGLGP